MGLLELHGINGHSVIRTKVVHTTSRQVLTAVVRANVKPGSNLDTDSQPSYRSLGSDFVHEFIDHAECCARGAVHTNGLENFAPLPGRTGVPL